MNKAFLQRLRDPKLIRTGFVCALLILALIAAMALRNTLKLKETDAWVEHTHGVIVQLNQVASSITDAETSQRGFVITGRQSYLDPYTRALASLDGEIQTLKELTRDNFQQQQRISELEVSVKSRLITLADVIDKRNKEGFEQAQRTIVAGNGKEQMDDIRRRVAEIEKVEETLLASRKTSANASTRLTLSTFGSGFAASFVLLLLVFLLLNHQIAERREAEESVKRYADQLVAANKELEAFSYSTSHDLRAPLRHLAGYAELLQRNAASQLDETSQRYVATIVESAQRMGKLIDLLLAFSRLGRSQIRMTDVDLGDVAEEAINELQVEMKGREVALTVGELPRVTADPSLLRLVFTNLISNALKFTSKGRKAEVEIGCTERPGELVVFVKDNGAGFDMKYADKLFGVFQRLHRADEFEGTGIGLANVRRIINRHGGRTWAEGRVGAGATFYFSLSTHSARKLDRLADQES
ncbi:MAG TPA: CHASE3 domain-containing protein [Pyrinomonadaceae bacterium]|nr:CHASE3 domain-containing protein [Pyrinomonadaceae bacterium]